MMADAYLRRPVLTRIFLPYRSQVRLSGVRICFLATLSCRTSRAKS